MKFAVICSAGGSAFFSAFDMLFNQKKYTKSDFVLITDRACDAEHQAMKRGIQYQRIVFESKQQFSADVANFLDDQEIAVVFMLYSRLVTADLFLKFPTLNIHPALLPAFKGMNAVSQAMHAGAKFIGATLHLTTEKIDDGAFLAQVVSPIKNNINNFQAEKLSFLQKTYLILVVLDAIRLNLIRISPTKISINWPEDTGFSCSANPCIPSSDLRHAFSEFQASHGMADIIK